ncbi:MAG: LysM peptidoglycan-binding domain-containing protein [Bacteroidaceae bacterium]|nr:LysM peptidoglycan-binding domain-containing protein [Bacteroidaceae bacterium]
MNIKSVFFCVLLCLIGLSANAQTNHEIQPGETLYGISHKYGITITEIEAANPGLSENIMAGQVIVIPNPTPAPVVKKDKKVMTPGVPVCKETYIVQKKETLYGIARDHGITLETLLEANPELSESQKLKKGYELCIPYTDAELTEMFPPAPVPEIKKPDPVSFAVIMPYGLSSEKKNKDMITMVDFYEGVMLALADLKQEGVSAKVYAYDEADFDSILGLPEMKTLDFIIGPKNSGNISRLTSFTKQNNMELVVPMSSESSLVNSNPHVFQVNCKMNTNDYARAFDSFVKMHPNANYVFVNIADQMDKADYVASLKSYLNKKNVEYHSVEFSNLSDVADMLTYDRENIMIISSSLRTAFDRTVRKLNDLQLESYHIQMLGYNDWQAFAEKDADSFRKYGCMFFTAFYNNPNATSTMTFNQKFRRAFGRDQLNVYPRYGMLGYDVANYFVRHKYEQGEEFLSNIENLSTQAYQNPLHFTHKNAWSGFVNNAMMFVQYNGDGTISVKQY